QSFTNKDATKWSNETHTIDLDSGEKINLTTTEIMELYALSYRTQAMGHILYGGIKSGTKGNDAEHPYKVTESDLDTMFALLSAKQTAIVDEMQQFMSTTASAWGNEVTQQLYLFDAFNEEHYWPIRSAEASHDTKDPEKARAFNAMLNSSFTKQLTPNASSPIQIGDAFNTFVDHCSQMANYNGLAVPIQDTLKWLNYKARNDDGSVNHDATVKTALNRIGNKETELYIAEFIKDLNGLNAKARNVALAEKLTSNVKRAAIAAKVRVVIQQPTSVIRATAMIDPKYFATRKQFNAKRAVKEMQEYAPIAWWKSNGNYEIGIGQTMRGMIMGDATAYEEINSKLMKPAGLADDLGWSWIWNAVKEETKDTTDLAVNSPEFYQHCAKRFTDVCNATQVIDTPLHRSEIMRSKDSGVKQLTAFMSEPAKNFNIMRNALLDAYRKKPGAKQRLGRTTAAVIAAQAVNALVTSLWDAARKRGEDDEKTFMQLFGDTWVTNFVSGINPLSTMPFVSDISDLLVSVFKKENADVPKRMDLDAISSAAFAVTSFLDTVAHHNESRYTLYYGITNLAKQVSSLFGLPVNGVISSIEGIVDIVFPGVLRRYKPQLKKEWQQEMLRAADESGISRGEFYDLYEDIGKGEKAAEKAQALYDAEISTEQMRIVARVASDTLDYSLAELQRQGASEKVQKETVRYYSIKSGLVSHHDDPAAEQLKRLLLEDDTLTAEEKSLIYTALQKEYFTGIEAQIFRSEKLSNAEKNALYESLDNKSEMEKILWDNPDLTDDERHSILKLGEQDDFRLDFSTADRLKLSSISETTYNRALTAERKGVSNAAYLKYYDVKRKYATDDVDLETGKDDVLQELLKDNSLTLKQKAELEKAMYENLNPKKEDYVYTPHDYTDEAHFYISGRSSTLYPMKAELAEQQGFDYDRVAEYVRRWSEMSANKQGSGKNGAMKKADSYAIMSAMGFTRAEQNKLYKIMVSNEEKLKKALGKE
ncbi:MAG: hypothetical protein IKK29_06590, partial [Christensenellaceae bacterium]|nr:hypothetical protein [Christensenellaceae bacterium]